MLAAEAGAIVANKRVKKGAKEPDAPIDTAVGAVLGLLAFMLGFTFSLTEERFSDRKELVIQEANAINTCYLRANLIPEKQKNAIRKYLREYTGILLMVDGKKVSEQSIARMKELHNLMWQEASSLVKEDLDSEIRTFFLGSLNDVINVYEERKTISLVFRIPDIIWSSLLLLTVLGIFFIGYQTGTYGIRRLWGVPLLAASFAMVMVLIAEMDTTGEGRFKISQEPLKNVQETMQKDAL
ncbi:hypothetical protein I5M27_05875 [Adhaeribacter sp. BT258]|uniref:DUF4239 domain-containing protein n=1 Tax=Adhaeribacter terrigena TaxID=2793070 RepID=A0ABS1BZB4_9BACT|nr:hypothetical protein [Adhaeribacter terrigena]MBK0402505.1 hypothetical protein [Adhaeribacter terrigena]